MGTDETPQETLNLLIYSFSLAVSLWVICCTHVQLCSSFGNKQLPECASENRVSVTDDNPGHTMQLVHIV